MRESIGGTFIINIILIFIVIFITFMSIAINYAKVFRIKNNVINIVEQNQFLMDDSYTDIILDKIDSYLENVPYNENGNKYIQEDCGNTFFGGKKFVTLDGISPGAGSTILTNRGVCITRLGDANNIYYNVTAYISIKFPFFGLNFTVPVRGETKIISA